MSPIPTTLGRYRIERLLGAGAFGEVFLATLRGAEGFEKRFAIKVLASDRPGFDTTRQRAFIREGLLGADLQHANIVGVHEFGEEAGRYYLVMDYIDGISLRALLALCSGRGTRLPVDAVCDLGGQICAGLDHAHRASTRDGRPLELVHRDLKPANLMLDRTGTVRIVDFGIARTASQTFFTTAAGQVKGTPAYMAPEQVAGEATLSGAVDQFALALVLCEAVTGEPVFATRSVESLLYQILECKVGGALDRLRAAAPDLVPPIERAMQRNPAGRFASAGEMGEALREIRWRHAAQPRLSLVARATVGLRPGEDTVDTDIVTAIFPTPEGESDAGAMGSWEAFCTAFADQLGPDLPDLATPRAATTGAEPASGGWIRGKGALLALLVAGVLLVAGIGVWRWGSGGAGGATPSGDDVVAPVVPVPPSDAADVEPATPAGDEPETPRDVAEVEPETQALSRPVEVREPAGAVEDREADEATDLSPTAAPSGDPTPGEVTTGTGTLRINSRPWSEVWLDDLRLGRTSTPSFEAPAGHHTVRLQQPSLGVEKTFDVEIRPGETVSLGCWDFEAEAPCVR